MSLISGRDSRKTIGELKKYGLIMFAALAVLSGLLFWREKASWIYTAVPSVLFLLFALVFPRALGPVEKIWMKLAEVLGFVMTNVILFLVFVIAIIPTGFLLRLFGKTPLAKGFSTDASTYWIDVEKNGPSSRPDKPY